MYIYTQMYPHIYIYRPSEDEYYFAGPLQIECLDPPTVLVHSFPVLSNFVICTAGDQVKNKKNNTQHAQRNYRIHHTTHFTTDSDSLLLIF